MKKITLMLLFTTLFITGCGSRTKLSGPVIGKYDIGQLDYLVLSETTATYGNENFELKNIKVKGDEDFNFDMYKDEEKQFECTTTFNSLYCTAGDGNILAGDKVK